MTSASPSALEAPDPDRRSVERFVAQRLDGLFAEAEVISSTRFRGGQSAADHALERFDVTGYAGSRNEAYPEPRRGASGLSPYIRHGLLSLPRVWAAVDGGPVDDVEKFRNELLWQEYARHWYARLGSATAAPLRRTYAGGFRPVPDGGRQLESGSWNLDMACLELTTGELEDEGWLVNQTRMWLASHWTVRNHLDWRAGEDYFFRHLLDGSRAANRLGWQWTTGIGSNRSYGFTRWQVEKRAPGLCASCEVAANCPIAHWPDEPELVKVDSEPLIGHDPDVARRRGPGTVETWPPLGGGVASQSVERSVDGGEHGAGSGAEAVWLTAESLGSDDPALAANPDLPAVFVFDAPLLVGLGLSSKRLVFMVEALAEMAIHRPVEIHVGDPVTVLGGRPLATTYAPVPGWRHRAARLAVAQLHPWPWLRVPGSGNIGSFAAWAKQIGGPLDAVGQAPVGVPDREIS